MAAPTEAGQVIQFAVTDDPIPATRRLVIQSMFAVNAAVVTDGGGSNPVWEATAAGQWVNFPAGLPTDGIDVTGTGPVYIYLK